jgi:hypothetical protein
MSVDPRAKSVRERCILVAAIIIMMAEGGWRICGKEVHENHQIPSSLATQTNTYDIEWNWC